MMTRLSIKTILYGLIVYIAIVLIFGVLYWLTNGIHTNDDAKLNADLFDSIYFSFITFATIGYGDYVPAISFSKTLVFFETTLSVFTLQFSAAIYFMNSSNGLKISYSLIKCT